MDKYSPPTVDAHSAASGSFFTSRNYHLQHVPPLLQRSSFNYARPSFSVDTKEREAFDGQMAILTISATADWYH